MSALWTLRDEFSAAAEMAGSYPKTKKPALVTPHYTTLTQLNTYLGLTYLLNSISRLVCC